MDTENNGKDMEPMVAMVLQFVDCYWYANLLLGESFYVLAVDTPAAI